MASQLHIGSSKDAVLAFVGSLKIDSLDVKHSDNFRDGERLHFDSFDNKKRDALGDKLKEYYDALIIDVMPSSETFISNIRIRFYFDKDGKVLDCSIAEDGDFR